MNAFSLKDIENLSGIKAHTWRIWEQRYGINVAQRKDSLHRFYDAENLKNLLQISYLYHKGIKISKIATLSDQQKAELALANRDEKTPYQYYINQLIEASVEFDETKFHQVLSKAIDSNLLEDVYIKLIVPFQEKIGLLWLTNHVLPAQEHFTSNIIMSLMAQAIDKLPVAGDNERHLVLFTPLNEFHEIPLFFFYYLLKKQGKSVTYFGSNVSISALENYVSAKGCSHIVFYLITNLTNVTPGDYLKQLCDQFNNQVVVMAGPQVHQVQQIPRNAYLLTSLHNLVQFAKEQ